MPPVRLLLILPHFLVAPAFAQSAPECTCNNLESLQQEYQNAVYLEKEFRDLSKALKEWEATAFKRAAAEGLNVAKTSRAMVAKAARDYMTVPFPAVTDSNAPKAVELIPGFCHPNAADLTAVEKGAPCSGLAEAEALNVVRQQLTCEKMGADKYWKRMGSEVALEKADNYKDKVAQLKSEIGKVLETADVRLRGEWLYTLSQDMLGAGDVAVHFATFDSGDMKLASDGKDGWKLTGTGSGTDTIVEWKVPGMDCSITGTMTSDLFVTLGTNGLTFGVEMTETNFRDGYGMTCQTPEGTATSTPSDDGSAGNGFSGTVASGKKLTVGDTALESPWADFYAKEAKSYWGSVEGEPSTSLSITCEK